METELVFKGENGLALTNSLLVAERFGKEHKHVLDAVRKLITTAENSAVLEMFVETQYVNEQNKEQPMFVMNRDGFTLLAMGFTGKKAMKFKLDYINAFNKMEKALKESQKQLSPVELFALQAQINLDAERRVKALEHRMDSLEKEREENRKQLLSVPLSDEKLPEIKMRDKIRQLVNRYSTATNTAQQDVWHKIYDQLYYLYHISVRAYKKEKRETYLDVAERNHFLDKVEAVVSNMVRESQA